MEGEQILEGVSLVVVVDDGTLMMVMVMVMVMVIVMVMFPRRRMSGLLRLYL